MIELTTDEGGVEEEPPSGDDAVPVTHGIDDDNNTEKQHATNNYHSRVQLMYSAVGGLFSQEDEEVEDNISGNYFIFDTEFFDTAFDGESTLTPQGIEQLLSSTTLNTDNITFLHWYQLDQDLPGEIDALMRGFRDVHEDLGDSFIAAAWQKCMSEKALVKQDEKVILRALQTNTGEVYAKNRYQK